MNAAFSPALLRAINLFVPGGGLILLRQPLRGAALAVAFTALANLAVIATLHIPDEFSSWQVLAILGGLLTTFAAAQSFLARALRRELQREQERRRAASLCRVHEALAAGNHDAAWAALEPLRGAAGEDLHVAVRVAQVLAMRGETLQALAAWERVARLDRHRVYRDEIETARTLLFARGAKES